MRPSTVGIFFREQEVILLKRVEVYTYTDFVAICGGLLGLFLGASVLSVVEFLYYSTLRLYWTLRKWKSESRIVPLNRTIFNRVSIDIPKIYNEMYKKNEPNPFKRPFIPNWYAYRPWFSILWVIIRNLKVCVSLDGRLSGCSVFVDDNLFESMMYLVCFIF